LVLQESGVRTIESGKLYEIRAEVAKSLSHPLRLKIIDLLSSEDELCVQDLTVRLEASQSNISKHLKILRQAGILSRESEGLKNYYSLRVPCVAGFFDCLDEILREEYMDKSDRLDLT